MAKDKDTKDRESTRSYARRYTPQQRHPEGERLSWSGLERLTPQHTPYRGSVTPFSLMRRYAEDLDRIFSDFGGGALMGGDWSDIGSATSSSVWSPQIESFRRGDNLVIRADLPGMKKENVNVEIDDDALILSGERQDESSEEKDDFYRSERSYGSFYRVVPLPDGVDPDSCDAKFENGVLEVTLPAPKETSQNRKHIDIK